MTARGTSSVEFGIIPVNVLPFFEERLQEIVETHATGILNIMTFAELLHWLKEDKLELWVGMYNKQVEVAVITQVVKHSVYSSLSILWLGGKNMLRYRRLGLQKLEYFAAAHKLQNLSFSGPEFWAISVGNLGFKPKQIEYNKPITYYIEGQADPVRKH